MATVETQGYSLQKLEELLSDALPMCFYICKMLLPNEKTAMLISADAYKKVLKNPDRIPEEKDFLPWVKNVVMVACASFLKKQDEGIFLKNNPAPEIPKLEILHNRNLNVSATAKHLENAFANSLCHPLLLLQRYDGCSDFNRAGSACHKGKGVNAKRCR